MQASLYPTEERPPPPFSLSSSAPRVNLTIWSRLMSTSTIPAGAVVGLASEFWRHDRLDVVVDKYSPKEPTLDP